MHIAGGPKDVHAAAVDERYAAWTISGRADLRAKTAGKPRFPDHFACERIHCLDKFLVAHAVKQDRTAIGDRYPCDSVTEFPFPKRLGLTTGPFKIQVFVIGDTSAMRPENLWP